jgi:hypothetical protein
MGSLRHHQGQINDLLELIDYIEGNNLILVEIGSFKGESMEIFANSGKFSKIYCIDPWKNGYDDDDTSSNVVQFVESFFDKRKEKYPFVEKIKMTSLEAADAFQDTSIDIVYIDGDHRPEMVKKDIHKWFGKVKPNGYISGHDWYYRDGLIQKTIIETIGHPDHICEHVMYGGNGDGSWIKNKNNIKMI